MDAVELVGVVLERIRDKAKAHGGKMLKPTTKELNRLIMSFDSLLDVGYFDEKRLEKDIELFEDMAKNLGKRKKRFIKHGDTLVEIEDIIMDLLLGRSEPSSVNIVIHKDNKIIHKKNGKIVKIETVNS